VTFEACERLRFGRVVRAGEHAEGAHYHDLYELLVVRCGNGTVESAGRSFHVGPGDAVLIAPETVHYHARLCETETWSVQFRRADVELLLPIVDAHAGRFTLAERAATEAILAATLAGRSGAGPVVRLQLSAVVAALLGNPRTVPRACAANPAVRGALEVIDREYATLAGASDVARVLGKSLGYLTDLVRAETGHSLGTWLLERRLFAASFLLATRSTSVIDVALAVGFSDPGHFARQFARRFGVVPSAWQRHLAQQFAAVNEVAS
jgi:AraC-like DNA-binding protein